MPGVLDRVNGQFAALRGRPQNLSLDEYADYFSFGGEQYPILRTSYNALNQERIARDTAWAARMHGPTFALVYCRMRVFSQIRFQWTRMQGAQPSDLFGTSELKVLERPWPGGTTSDLLARMEWDVSTAGNAYVRRRGPNLHRLMPAWVIIVLGSQEQVDNPAYAADTTVAGYYWVPPGGQSRFFTPQQVAHFCPVPDPFSHFLGESWMAPVLRELQADQAAVEHKWEFFNHAATPNYAIAFDPAVSLDAVRGFKELMETEHAGVRSAWKTLYLGGGAKPVPVGTNFRDMDYAVIQGRAEPLAADTPVPTPSGWTTMGEIAPGDQVFGRDGRPANVVAAGPVRHGRQCYRITLKNGESIVADAGHVWTAVDRGTATRSERQYTTQEMYDLFTRPYPNGAGGHRLSLPGSPVLELPESDLLIDPYVLGAWLGDGQTAGASICGDWADLKYIAAEFEERGYTTRRWESGRGVTKHAGADNAVIGVPGGLLSALSALGVLGGKRIPDEYLRASASQRLDLLRGLMDTDGTVATAGQRKRGGCAFSSKDEVLARQVLELARSLGYRASIGCADDSRSRTGHHWRVYFRSRLDAIPFLLPRKADRCEQAGEPYFSEKRSIASIVPVEPVPVRCITVDTDDHLFLAGDGFIPVHNSRLAAAAGVHPSIVGFSEGLQGSSLNAGNYGAARRLFAESTMAHLWGNAASSLEPLLSAPPGASLWPDSRIPFTRQDEGDRADVQAKEAATIGSLIKDGYKPDSAVAAVRNNDWSLLVHSGLVSVQLWEPGTESARKPEPGAESPAQPAGGQPLVVPSSNGHANGHGNGVGR